MMHNFPEPENPLLKKGYLPTLKQLKDQYKVPLLRFAKCWGLVNARRAWRSLLVVEDDKMTKWTCLKCASRLKRHREEFEKGIMIRHSCIVKKIDTDN